MTTACFTDLPRNASAVSFILVRICGGGWEGGAGERASVCTRPANQTPPFSSPACLASLPEGLPCTTRASCSGVPAPSCVQDGRQVHPRTRAPSAARPPVDPPWRRSPRERTPSSRRRPQLQQAQQTDEHHGELLNKDRGKGAQTGGRTGAVTATRKRRRCLCRHASSPH